MVLTVVVSTRPRAVGAHGTRSACRPAREVLVVLVSTRRAQLGYADGWTRARTHGRAHACMGRWLNFGRGTPGVLTGVLTRYPTTCMGRWLNFGRGRVPHGYSRGTTGVLQGTHRGTHTVPTDLHGAVARYPLAHDLGRVVGLLREAVPAQHGSALHMCISVYVYICIITHIYICVYIHMHVYIYPAQHSGIYIGAYIYMYICVCVCVCAYIHTHICTCAA